MNAPGRSGTSLPMTIARLKPRANTSAMLLSILSPRSTLSLLLWLFEYVKLYQQSEAFSLRIEYFLSNLLAGLELDPGKYLKSNVIRKQDNLA